MSRGEGGGAPPGNNNAGKNKPMRDALRKLAVQDGGKKMHSIAMRMFNMAEAGDLGAMKEIGDRLDGKVSQEVTGENGNPIQIVIQATDVDL